MPYQYILHENAQSEYETSLAWYKERSELAARNFILAIDYSLELICNSPTQWRNEYKNYYELNVKKFPFSVIYTINQKEQLIIIHSLHHHKKNPKTRYRKRR